MKRKDSDKTLQDELRQIAPELSEMKHEDGFTTPHNYFKELPDRVFAQIAAEEQRPVLVWDWLRGLWKPRFAIAFASVLVLVVAGVWYSRMQTSEDPLLTITKDEALEYVLNNLYDYNSEDFISADVFAEWDATEMMPVTKEDLNQMMQDAELIEELMN